MSVNTFSTFGTANAVEVEIKDKPQLSAATVEYESTKDPVSDIPHLNI